MQKADTVGTFQIESRAQMATLPRMKPAMLLRRGHRGRDHPARAHRRRPDASLPAAAQRQGSRSPIMHPDLEPVLERTLGVPLFQEQMLRIAMIMADFDGGEAEELRRAISFHRSHERMEKVVVKLRAQHGPKAESRRRSRSKSSQALSSFALYGFPESPRHQLRPAGLRQLLAEGPPRAGVLLRAAQQPADGLLFARHADQGRQAARRAVPARLRRPFRCVLPH